MRGGSTTLIMGPMFSGKTSTMQTRIKNAVIACRKVVVIMHVSDTRYTRKDMATSHDGHMISAIRVSDLKTVPEKLAAEDIDMIGIDEGHFMAGLADFCMDQNTKGRDVIVAALLGDSELKMWPNVAELLPLAHFIEHKHAICTLCQDPYASYSRKIVARKNGDSNVDVGADDKYVAVCRDCMTKPIPAEVLQKRQEAVRLVREMSYAK